MSRRDAALVVGAAAALAVLAVVWWAVAGRRSAPDAPSRPVIEPGGAMEMVLAELYFPSIAGWLGAESRELPAAASPEERAAQVAAALLAGPRESTLRPPLADGVELSTVHLTDDGVIYLDLAAAQLTAPPVSGSRGELLTVYSFVNSLLANVPEARGVVLLWNGNQRPTFAGHVDTTRPLPAERKWVTQRPS